MILEFLVFFLVFFMSIIFHEVGHALYYNYVTGKLMKIHFYYDSWRKFGWKAGEDSDYQSLTDKQYLNLTLSGIALGEIVIISASLLFSPWLLWLSLSYFYGCKDDIIVFYTALFKLGDHA